MAFIMSTEGQQVVSDEGYIPVADVEAYAGSAPEGSCVVGGSSSVSPLMEKLIEAYAAVNRMHLSSFRHLILLQV